LVVAVAAFFIDQQYYHGRYWGAASSSGIEENAAREVSVTITDNHRDGTATLADPEKADCATL